MRLVGLFLPSKCYLWKSKFKFLKNKLHGARLLWGTLCPLLPCPFARAAVAIDVSWVKGWKGRGDCYELEKLMVKGLTSVLLCWFTDIPSELVCLRFLSLPSSHHHCHSFFVHQGAFKPIPLSLKRLGVECLLFHRVPLKTYHGGLWMVFFSVLSEGVLFFLLIKGDLIWMPVTTSFSQMGKLVKVNLTCIWLFLFEQLQMS